MTTGLTQAVLYNHRERRRSHRDITQGLFKSSSIPVSATPDLSALPKNVKMTLTGKVQTSGVPSGQFFAVGGTSISVAAGVLTLGWDGSSQDSAVIPSLAYDSSSDPQNFDFAVSLWPGRGQARLWLNSDLVIRLNGVVTSQWAGAGLVTKDGTNIVHIAETNLHSGQVPRHFD